MTEEDVYFSFLPLAHIFDRIIEEYSIRSGASIGFWQGVSISVGCEHTFFLALECMSLL